MTGIIAAEGGYQEFTLKGGEWLVLWLSAAAAILAIAVGFYLVRSVLAADQGSPKMREIAEAIQEGAWAYLKRQFKTIGYILIPLVVIVFVTSTAIKKGDGTEALSFGEAGLWRTVGFVLGCLASGLTGYIGMTLATRGNVRTAAAALTNSMPKALTVAFRTGGVAGMFTVGLGLIGATAIIMIFQNSSSVILVGFGFGGSLLALFLRVGGADDAEVDLGGAVLGVVEVDHRRAADDADRHRRNEAAQRPLRQLLLLLHPQQRVVQRDDRAVDRRRARAAVGADDVAVDPQRDLGELLEIDGAAQRAADQALDLEAPAVERPAGAAVARLTRLAGAGQHRVLRGQPAALVAVVHPLRHLVLHGHRAQDLGLAALGEHRPGQVGVAARERDRTELVRGAVVLASQGRVPRKSGGAG